ncbi:MAG: hypothetical protein SWE60_01960 [Thermodesulfobacteriota bacterium]|nr:hypothetical protein [Thermodesulfobacteriota bacterium]
MYIWTYCSNRNCQIYFKRSGSSTVYSGGSVYLSCGSSGGLYEVDMRGCSNWTGTITQIRIDPSDNFGSVTTPGFVAFDWIETSQIVNNPPIVDIAPDEEKISHGWNGGVTVASHDPNGDSYSCQWRIRSGSWHSAPQNGWFQVPAGDFVIGTNDICVRCTDIYGIYGQKCDDITDYAVPSVAPGNLSPSGGMELDIQPSYPFVFSGVADPGHGQTYHYQVLIAENSGFSPTIDQREIAGSPFYVNDDILDSGKTYYWKICGENQLGTQGPWSQTWFRIKRLNRAPVVTAFALDRTEISHGWDLGVTVAAYDPDGDGFSWSWKVNGSSWNPTSPNSSGWFEIPASAFSPGSNSVYVRATDIYGAHGEPSPQTVTDYLVPNEEPWGLSPSGGEPFGIETHYEFVFGGVSNAHHYQVIIADNDQYASPVFNGEVAGSPFYVGDSVLRPGKTYYWKICGVNKPGTHGPWAETWFVIVGSPTVSNVQVSAESAENGDALSISWTSTNQNHWLTYLYDSTGTNPVNTSFCLSANCIAAGSDGSDGCLNQANPSSATSTIWVIPDGLRCEYTIKVKVWNALGQPPAGVGGVSNPFLVCKGGTPPPDEPMGIVARTCDDPDVYWVKYGKKWPFVDQATFFNLGYADAEIKWYCPGALDGLPLGKRILQDDDDFVYRKQSISTVYIVRNGNSDWFFNWQAFINSGFGHEDVFWANDQGFSWIQAEYPLGELVGPRPRIRVTPESLLFE